MKSRWLWIVISANLVVLVALAFIYPHLMVSPGALVAGHAELATDCFACHAPLRGAASDRCVSCHVVADIGLRTSKGAPIVRVAASNGATTGPITGASVGTSAGTSAGGLTGAGPGASPVTSPGVSAPSASAARGKARPKAAVTTSFHQELIEQDCVACHTDHAGPKLTHRSRKPFSHDLLKVSTREVCESCHAAPTNDLHRRFDKACVQCHKTQGWTPASFDHDLLTKADQNSCGSCHKAPDDTLHRQIVGNCGSCHTSKAWTPATFDHAKYFVLDRDHNASCVTCHTGNNYQRTTCYGCHEHTPANIRAEHEEEGIANLDNCVRCHRSAQDKGEGGGRGEGR
ncbi:MAG: hypothetical protein RL375_33, partial [Pseudomonadota bacterium]